MSLEDTMVFFACIMCSITNTSRKNYVLIRIRICYNLLIQKFILRIIINQLSLAVFKKKIIHIFIKKSHKM